MEGCQYRPTPINAGHLCLINTISYNNERKKKNRINDTKTYTISLNIADPSGKHNT